MSSKLRAIDLFCGAGGTSRGISQAGVEVIAGFDMWDMAGYVYKDNFPDAGFYEGKLEDFNIKKLVSELGKVDLITASPECTNHSPAKGNKPRCELSKETAFQVVRYAKAFKPRWLVIENVVSMRKWSRYGEFLDKLGPQGLGYKISEHVFVASDFGVPQSRRRLFILCDLKRKPGFKLPINNNKKNAADIIDQNNNYKFSPLKTKKRAAATLDRAERAIKAVGKNQEFLLVYYGSDHAGGWQRLDRPLRTITTVDRFALVKPSKAGHMMRMLQIPELKKAMGMPRHKINHGTRRDGVKMLGNGVCPPVMKHVLKCLINN